MGRVKNDPPTYVYHRTSFRTCVVGLQSHSVNPGVQILRHDAEYVFVMLKSHGQGPTHIERRQGGGGHLFEHAARNAT